MKTITKLMQLSRKEWPLLAWGLLFLALSSGAMLAYPHTIKKIIDEALTHKNQGQLNKAALLAVGIFALQSVTSALRYYFFTLAGEKTVKRLRENLFGQILGQNVTFFDSDASLLALGQFAKPCDGSSATGLFTALHSEPHRFFSKDQFPFESHVTSGGEFPSCL